MDSIKSVVVGDASVGKTCLLISYEQSRFLQETDPTVFDFHTVTVTIESETHSMEMIDTAGMEDYNRLRPLSYSGTNVFFVCFSVVSPASFDNVKEKWVPEITHHCPNTPFLLVGLKTDLRKDTTKEQPVTADAGEKLAHELGAVKYLECSALTQEGLKNVFEEGFLAAVTMGVPRRAIRHGLFRMPKFFKRRSEERHSQAKWAEEKRQEKEAITIIKPRDVQLLDVIGRGGFGAVFRGTWKARKEEVVAVKKCTLTGTKQDPDVPREVQILRSVPEHPHIISFYGMSINFPDILIVVEFAEKGSLFNYLHKEKQIPTIEQSLTWALQVAKGMQHLHSHDIIHRDLKSANVLLSSTMTVKLCDFGTARYLSHTTVQTKASGTFRWMAPEVMEAVEANINKKCDSFSYGMVLYELLVHQVPYYDTPGDGIVCVKVMQGERPAIPPTIPQFLNFLLKECWEKDPHKRPTFQNIVQKLSILGCLKI